MRRGLALAVTVVIAGATAACGSDDLKPGESLSKDEYLDRGNELCAEFDERNAELSEELGEDPDSAEVKAFMTEALREYERLIDDLREGIPSGDEARVNRILDQRQEVIDESQANPAVANEGYRLVPTNRAFSEYGLTECGS